ncbi:hypothetical protein AFE_1835 [Acidithiobacillus ferrooxidans ATCC 23270]|uniref:Uncharacterized protein n=1 Tax=Acidithiobacillus ferrooxidans (strain ATCC 23270 / DSM 14882 / CIP 104768 / NCIMB 8455) TaxID=243159 RepID=B7JBU0_ACIF2|nr:hypothetical protein AFE_1835 [Acidithiobacillus ferrooxidans ATCC 23270]
MQLLERGHLSICTFFILPTEEGREIDKLVFSFRYPSKITVDSVYLLTFPWRRRGLPGVVIGDALVPTQGGTVVILNPV